MDFLKLTEIKAVLLAFIQKKIEDPGRIKEIFETEVINMCRENSWACLWQWHGISSVTKRPIQSVFPDRVASNLKETLTYFIQPCEMLQVVSLSPFHFLWSKMGNTCTSAALFIPNHFVPLVSRTAMELSEGKFLKLLVTIMPDWNL